jgi:uncharacterized protein
MNLRLWLKKGIKLFFVLMVLAVCLGLYANQIEPYRIEVTRHQISAPLKSPIKIAHLSDLHTEGVGKIEQKMLAILEAEQPDLIVITGDLISTDTGYNGCREVLKRLQAPLGVFVVPGNHENWYPPRQGRAYFDETGVTYLVNQNKQVREGLWIIGLDDAMTQRPDFEKANAGVPADAYKIALFHSPAFFDVFAVKIKKVF